MRKSLFVTLLILGSQALTFAQTTYKTLDISVERSHTFSPKEAKPGFNVQLKNIEAPSPDGSSYKSFLLRQKIESRKRYPLKADASPKSKASDTPQPEMGKGLQIKRRLGNGSEIDFTGGAPNDNTLAVSNGGFIMAAVNSVVWAYDLNGDSTVFSLTNVLGLSQLAEIDGSRHYYDPKLIYDEDADRFILVFLRDNSPSGSAIVVCFSSSADPLDPWHVYLLPGNPLDNNRWTDFPAINVTKGELFITGNLIVPDEPWQIGFDGSVIWQVDKKAGYSNAENLSTRLYSDIKFEDRYIRNLHPVRGTSGTTATQYFLSNRNFDITNDTIFLLEIKGLMDDPATKLNIRSGKSDLAYGVPPNARQADTDTTDPTKGLQTNDARVLGAITNGEWIQFVSNTLNPATGLSAVYHGFIKDPGKESQEITGTILGDPVLDFGYPNIAFTGNECCDVEAIIGVNYTSPNDFPGLGAFYFGNDTSHSGFLRIKEGLNYVDKHSDSYERWGDYFGIQTKYNEQGKAWVAGFFGLEQNGSGTWINELTSPDSMKISVQAVMAGEPIFCAGRLEIVASGGVSPYSYSFGNDTIFSSFNFTDSICDGDTIFYRVADSRGCVMKDTLYSPAHIIKSGDGAYPNPFTDQVVSQFHISHDQQVSAYIYGTDGKLVSKILDSPAKKGLNELIFNLTPLRAGVYILKVMAGDKEILTERMIKEY